MDILCKRCCGLDVHKKTITGCIITPEGKAIATFGTMTKDLQALVAWIKEKGCTHVAMESTGVYWIPVYNLLETENLDVIIVNANHIKNVPGRKTDVSDAEWIADLLRHGLLKGSFIPPRKQRELRELTRYRRSLIGEHTREVNRIQKVLEGCNLKLSSVVSRITGTTASLILKALIHGEIDPEVLASFAKGRLVRKKNELMDALNGFIGPHQQKLLALQIDHLEYLEKQITALDEEIAERLRPFEDDLTRLDTIPGVGRRTAEDILAEIGSDMSLFPSAQHLSSWAGMAPGNRQSAGKRKSGRTTKGNRYLRATLCESAQAIGRMKPNFLSQQFHRIAARRGRKRATIAVGHSILMICYHLLKRKTNYVELGANFYDQRKEESIVRHVLKRLESLGYAVSLEKVGA